VGAADIFVVGDPRRTIGCLAASPVFFDKPRHRGNREPAPQRVREQKSKTRGGFGDAGKLREFESEIYPVVRPRSNQSYSNTTYFL